MFFYWKKVFSLSTTALLLIIGCSRYPKIRPVVTVITDGMGAEQYSDRIFEAHMCRSGKKGFDHLMKIMDSDPSPEVMAVCLRTMSHFSHMYFRLGCETILHNERSRILQTLYRLLRSEREEYVRLAVAHFYYHFDLWDETIVGLLKELADNDDKHIRIFAQLSLEKLGQEDWGSARVPSGVTFRHPAFED